MGKLLRSDSWIMEKLNRLADLMVLNLLYIIACIPVFTIGAATTALYSVCFRLDSLQEALPAAYCHAFARDFRQATAVWAISFLPELLSLLLLVSVRVYDSPPVLQYILLIPAAVLLLAQSFVFPQAAKFRNTCVTTYINSFFLILENIPASVIITVLRLLPILMIIFLPPVLFLRTLIVWLLFGFALCARLNCRRLEKIFARFIPAEDDVS